MEMKLEQNQRQVLSQMMLQSVNILQMSSQELKEYMNDVALENPLVDFEDIAEEDKDNKTINKLEWLANQDEQNRIYYQQEEADADHGQAVNMIACAKEETLADNLMAQLSGGNYSKKEYAIFEYIANSLDSRGFYTGTADEIADFFHIKREDAVFYLDTMKLLEPAGVCSRDLSECLMRQLERESADWSIEKEIVQDYLDLLGKNYLHVIAKKMNLPLDRVRSAKEKIQTLNPKPGQGFSERETLRYLIPDVVVIKLKDYFEIIVNDASYPEFTLNKEYVRMLKDKECEKDVKHYLLEKYREIEQIRSNIEKRNTTLFRLTRYLVERQKEFFQKGKGMIRPLQMQEAAEALKIHESTISRTVREKYLQCCWGIFPLGYFFAKVSYEGGQGTRLTPIQMKDKIRELVNGEDKKNPFSDQKLADILKSSGIEISRRTVAKYRESMEIADCRGRKQL